MKYTTELISRGVLAWLDERPFSKETRARRKAERKARRAGRELTSEQIETETIEETPMLRTSTGAGLAGIAVNILIQVLQAFPATAELATPEVAAALTTLAMWAVARVWKTPAAPGKF